MVRRGSVVVASSGQRARVLRAGWHIRGKEEVVEVESRGTLRSVRYERRNKPRTRLAASRAAVVVEYMSAQMALRALSLGAAYVCIFYMCMSCISRGLMDRSTIRRGAHATMGVGARPRRLGPGERARVVCEL